MSTMSSGGPALQTNNKGQKLLKNIRLEEITAALV